MTVFPAFPRDPRTVPKARQKNMIPSVLVPDLMKDEINTISCLLQKIELFSFKSKTICLKFSILHLYATFVTSFPSSLKYSVWAV